MSSLPVNLSVTLLGAYLRYCVLTLAIWVGYVCLTKVSASAKSSPPAKGKGAGVAKIPVVYPYLVPILAHGIPAARSPPAFFSEV